MMNKVIPFLWFNTEAEAAAEFYLSIFANSKKLAELHTTEAGPGPAGSVLTVSLEIEGQQVTFLNGGPSLKLCDAFSFVITCENQAEIDDYWTKLTEGGTETACGWLRDKFGVAWQVVPRNLAELLRHPAAMKAMMRMIKMDIAALEQAAS